MHSDTKQSEEYFKSIYEIFSPTYEGLIRGLSTNKAIHFTFSLEMYHYIVQGSSTPWEEFLENLFGFLLLLIRILRNKSLLGFFSTYFLYNFVFIKSISRRLLHTLFYFEWIRIQKWQEPYFWKKILRVINREK